MNRGEREHAQERGRTSPSSVRGQCCLPELAQQGETRTVLGPCWRGRGQTSQGERARTEAEKKAFRWERKLYDSRGSFTPEGALTSGRPEIMGILDHPRVDSISSSREARNKPRIEECSLARIVSRILGKGLFLITIEAFTSELPRGNAHQLEFTLAGGILVHCGAIPSP